MNEHSYSIQRRDLENFERRLAELAPDRRPEISTSLDHLRTNRFEIAVIGQIKAGKSTFLNALTEKPGFLPVDVNPWTAVITRMCFGDTRLPPGTARFSFFTKEEWVQITEKRSLVDRLRQNLKGLRASDADAREEARMDAERQKLAARVQRRVGDQLGNLLGTEQCFENVAREVLEQYLASGELEDPSRPDAGKYSDLTREAEICFALHPFSEACTVVDTPGTNDPFQARSGVTMRYLAHADAYLLVLHGPQALTLQDVELLNEILRGLHKDRIVVFINRIDNFNDIAGDTGKVVKRVRDWFGEHYPALSVPVLSGCAFWAERALRLDLKAAKAFLFKDGAREYGVAMGHFTHEQFAAWEVTPELHLEAIGHAMLACSGFPGVRRAMAETLLRSKGLALLDNGRRNLLAKAVAYSEEARKIADSLDKDASVLEGDAETVQRELEGLNVEIGEMANSKECLASIQEDSERELHSVVELALQDLADALDTALRHAASDQAEQLRTNGIGIWDDRVWNADVSRLRDQLERAFDRRYLAAARSVFESQKRFRANLRRGLAEVADLGTVEIDASLASSIDPAPSLEALAQDCAIDVGGFLDRLFADSEDVDARAKELELAVVEALVPAVNGLVAAARAVLEQAADSTIEAADEAVRRALARIEADLTARKRTYEARRDEGDIHGFKEQAKQAKHQAVTRRKQAADLEALAQEVCAYTIEGIGEVA